MVPELISLNGTLIICISNKYPGDVDAAGLGVSLRDPVDWRHLEMDWSKSEERDKASGELLHSVHTGT